MDTLIHAHIHTLASKHDCIRDDLFVAKTLNLRNIPLLDFLNSIILLLLFFLTLFCCLLLVLLIIVVVYYEYVDERMQYYSIEYSHTALYQCFFLPSNIYNKGTIYV